MKKGLLIAVSGFSGAGKGTLMKKLMDECPDDFALSISATTRLPREGEKEGVEYFFRSKDEFEKMVAAGELIEHAVYVGNYYGTPKKFVDEQRERGKDVLLEIEVQGVLQVKEKFPDTVTVFVTPPSIAELRKRLAGRGTEDEETIEKRISRAAEEVKYAYDYDYLLINDDIDKAIADLKDIVSAEHQKAAERAWLIKRLQDELGGKK